MAESTGKATAGCDTGRDRVDRTDEAAVGIVTTRPAAGPTATGPSSAGSRGDAHRLDHTATNTMLVEAALAGGPNGGAAWHLLVERHGRGVWKVLYSFHLSEHDRHDLFQATWLRALERLHQLRDPERITAWLMSIAANEARRTWRSTQQGEVVVDVDVTDAVLAEVPVGSKRLEAQERRAVAVAAISRLSPQCRDLVRLLTVDGLTYQDIEQIMGWPAGGVAIRRSRCIEKIRRDPQVSAYLRALARCERAEEGTHVHATRP